MQLPEGISIVRVNHPGLIKGPATFNRRLKTIFVYTPVFDSLQKFEQDFIICHELGHIETRDELQADRLAFDRYMQLGYTPSKAVEAIHNTLSYTNGQHNARYIGMIREAAAYDMAVNGNEKNKKLITMTTPAYLSEQDLKRLRSQVSAFGVTDSDFDNFLGFGAKAQERKEARTERKNMKAQARADLIASRAEKNRAKAEGIKTGTYKPTDVGGIVGSVTGAVSSIFGKSDTPIDQELSQEEIAVMEEAARKKKTTTYIVVGVVVVIVAVVLFVVLGKKKK